MNLRNQKRISAQILNVGQNRVWFDPVRMQEIKEAITKADLIALMKDKAIQKKPETGHSKGRTRKKKIQKSKGRQKGTGKRKGKQGARQPKKRDWINRIRQQRALLKRLMSKTMITTATYQSSYKKAKGGFFRSIRHMKGYLTDHGLIIQKKK
ncbi:MAG: 50S ribosomal protein L19e [archaeon]